MQRELQPLPVRCFHWIMAGCVMTLLVSGAYLLAPLSGELVPLRFIRSWHVGIGMLLLANLAGQIYYYSRCKRYRDILIMPRDRYNVPDFLRYVCFITDDHPNFGKYNPGQKLLFTLTGVAAAIAGGSGVLLINPDNAGRLAVWLGGLSGLRLVHGSVALFFFCFMLLHLYLVFSEDPAKMQAMFSGYIEE